MIADPPGTLWVWAPDCRLRILYFVRPYATRNTMTTTELLAEIFDDVTHPLAVQCARWMDESARFQDFVATYRTKIRKKVRGLRDEEGRGDLLFELATAQRLLRERRFTI